MYKNGEIIIYNTEDNQIKIEVNFQDETVWLGQKQMAVLFGKDRKTITEHIGNIFVEGELNRSSVCRKFQHTAQDGKNYNINYYNLDFIISVGYRVKSIRGTKFRIWATHRLREYIIKGFSMDDDRLSGKNDYDLLYLSSLISLFDDSEILVYSLTENRTKYGNLEVFKRDFKACNDDTLPYLKMLNDNWLLFVDSCSGSCLKIKNIVEESLAFNF